MSDFTDGAVVRLKSGGPKMTIMKIYSPSDGPLSGVKLATCQWFQEEKPMKENFPVKSLEVATDDEGPIEPEFS